MEYKIGRARRLVLALHALLQRMGRGFERARDWGIALLGVVVLVAAIGFGGAAWLPITGGAADVVIWLVTWVVLNWGLAHLLRWFRKRRFGTVTSRDIQGTRDALQFMFFGWLGLCALVVCAHELVAGESYGWAGGLGLVAAGTLIPVGIMLYRYLADPSQGEDP